MVNIPQKKNKSSSAYCNLSKVKDKEKYSGTIDLSGVNLFWEVMEKLENDVEPAETEWNRLFATPGYATLIAHEFSGDFFKEKFRLAFMPSKSTELEAALESDSDRSYLEHFVSVPKMKDAINKHLRGLKFSGIFDKAINAAHSFLPPSPEVGFIKPPMVAFAFFKFDARGYDPIVMDPLASMEFGDLSLFLGHEFHHYYRNKLPYALNFLNNNSAEACLMNMLISIESEGIADLINRDQHYSNIEGVLLKKRYDDLVKLAPHSIRYLDDWICLNGSSSSVRKGECEALRAKITNSGHELGYYMAKSILRHFTVTELVEAVGNPFSFFKLYGSAANNSEDCPNLSSQSWNVLRELESKYSQ